MQRVRNAKIAAMNRIFHPYILRIDGRNKTSPIMARNARKSNCCFLWADLNFDSHSSSQKFSSGRTALPQTMQCLCGIISVIVSPYSFLEERVNKVLPEPPPLLSREKWLCEGRVAPGEKEWVKLS